MMQDWMQRASRFILGLLLYTALITYSHLAKVLVMLAAKREIQITSTNGGSL